MSLKNMPIVDSPPSQEDQAEAALLALGATVDWHEIDQFFTFGRTDDGNYHVNCVGGRPNRWTVCRNMGEKHQADLFDMAFKSLAEAKAACERHYITGRWV